MKKWFKLGLYLVIVTGLLCIFDLLIAPLRSTKQAEAPTTTPTIEIHMTVIPAEPTVTDIPTPTPTTHILSPLSPTPAPTLSPTPTNTPTPKPTATPKPTKKPTPTPKKADISKGHAWKPWTSYKVYNIKSSRQYQLQQVAKTDNYGLRVAKDTNGEWRWCIAMAISWAGGQPKDIGRCIDIYMANGAVLKCCLADVKKTEHTQSNGNKYGAKGELMEFIIDKSKVSSKVLNSGDVSNAADIFKGEAVKVVAHQDLFIEGFGGK